METFEVALRGDQDETVSGRILQNSANRRPEQARLKAHSRTRRIGRLTTEPVSATGFRRRGASSAVDFARCRQFGGISVPWAAGTGFAPCTDHDRSRRAVREAVLQLRHVSNVRWDNQSNCGEVGPDDDMRKRITEPRIPAHREAIRMPSFAAVRSASSVKAKPVMKSDIVNPIPASQPAP